jgi:hypothetical protein
VYDGVDRYGFVFAYGCDDPVAGGGAKNSSTRSVSVPCETPWCQVSGPNHTDSPASTRCTSPVSGFASTRTPLRTWNSSSAPRFVR